VQFVIYRNYSSPEDKILQCSPWETRPDNLRKFMELIKVEGGQWREAIEVGLWHVNRENEKEEVSQVILIGDAPANTEEEVKEKRKGKDWKNSRFETPIHYVKEMQKLSDRKIPVHAFYVDEFARQNFEEIAKATGGRCEMLDINSPVGANMLTGLVTECILRNIGQTNGKGDALVEAYRKKFSKSYQ